MPRIFANMKSLRLEWSFSANASRNIRALSVEFPFARTEAARKNPHRTPELSTNLNGTSTNSLGRIPLANQEGWKEEGGQAAWCFPSRHAGRVSVAALRQGSQRLPHLFRARRGRFEPGSGTSPAGTGPGFGKPRGLEDGRSVPRDSEAVKDVVHPRGSNRLPQKIGQAGRLRL